MALHFCPAVASREEVAGGPADGLFFSGGWNTVPGLGGHAPIGVHLSVGVDTGGFISSPFGISMSFATSCTYNVSFWALAGPVPLAGAVYGDGAGSAAGGVAFSSNFGVRVYAGATTVGVPPHLRFAPQVTFSSPGAQFNAAADVPVSAQYGTSVRFDVGGPTGVTVSVNNEVELTAQASAPHGTGCVLQAKLGAFSAHAKLLSRTIRSPRGSPMLNSTLWGPTSCEP